MIRILFLDDEPLALKQMILYASKIQDVEVVAASTSTREALEKIDKADAVFTDINMPDMNGVDFVRSMKNPPLIVFTTAHADYAVEGFRVNAIDYLLKPFSFAEFKSAVEKVKKVKELESLEKASQTPQVIHFKADYKTVSVPLDSILYVESMSEYIKLHLDTKEDPFIVLYSMKRLIDELPPEHFMRIHRSYIISLARIREASATSVTLDGGITLPIGESFRADFRKYLSDRQ